MDERALTVRQVAKYLQVNERTVYKLAQAGKIPCFKVAATWRFWKREIDRWSLHKTTTLENEENSK